MKATIVNSLLVLAVLPVNALQQSCGSTGDETKPSELAHLPIFEASNPLLEPIPQDAEVDGDSSTYVSYMVQVVEDVGFLMPINSYAAPTWFADETTPRYDVFLNVYGTEGYCGKSYLLDVPIPAWAEADPGSDGHMAVVDESSGCVYDFWGYNNALVGPTPNAWWASGIMIDSDGIYHSTVGAGNAAGLSELNGAVWPDEIEAGYIPHALTFSLPVEGVKGGGPVPPATHSDGDSSEPYALPEGALVQLDPALDLDTLDLEPYERTIARALQEFGMYLVDRNGGNISIGAISGLSTEPNAWTGVLPDPTADTVYLSNIPVDRFRVLKLPEQVTYPGGCSDTPCGVYL